MNYDKQKIEAGSGSETQRAEAVANKFFDMAEKGSGAKDPKANEMFSAVGRETAQGNYDMGQRILESGAKWDDDLRGAASEINQLDRERTGAKPMAIEDVQNTISGYARDFEKMSKERGGRQSDLESSMALDNIVGDISEPGLEGINNALDYLEGTLKSKGNTIDSILKLTTLTSEDKVTFLKDWQEKRAMRDTLFQEKQKRIEQQKQVKQTTGEVDKGRTSASRNLKNLYSQAGVPEDTPSRQEFLTKVSRMSPDELHYLDVALKKTVAEFGRTRDQKLLDNRLMDLVSKSFKLEDVAKRQKAEDQRKIEEIRRSLNLPEQQPVEPASTREMPEQKQAESEVKNPFLALAESPETYLDRLKYEDKPNAYHPEKAISAVIEVFTKIYPDKKQLASRIEELFGQYTTIKDRSREEKPEKDESSHENFAKNQTTKRLTDAERKALEKIIEDKINITQRTFAGEAKSKFTKEFVFGDFIRFLENIKQ
jgi:hypothetical protein